jgi:hypothetical protein
MVRGSGAMAEKTTAGRAGDGAALLPQKALSPRKITTLASSPPPVMNDLTVLV